MERIELLYEQALKTYRSDYELAQRYVTLARRIAMRARVRQPRYLKRVVCKHCKSLIVPGYNCRVRIRQRREPHVTIYCMVCKRFTRIPLRRRKVR